MKHHCKKRTLTLIPSGGLANRMRAIASAYQLCQDTESHLRIIWFKDWALNAAFHDIFRPISLPGIELREARPADFLINDRPRRRNLWIPRLFQALCYGQCIYEKTITPRKNQGFDFEAWLTKKRCYMSCYQEFGSFPDALYSKLFVPVSEVMESVNKNMAQFTSYTIGMHIRRTDHTESIAQSPTEMFVAMGQDELRQHPDMKIFLATDDDGVKGTLKDAFGDKIITSDTTASRSNTNGIRDGLTDMYTLAHTKRIYDSFGSSFSPLAAKWGGVELNVIKRK